MTRTDAVTISFRADGATTHSATTIRRSAELAEALAGLTYGAASGTITASKVSRAGVRSVAIVHIDGSEDDHDALELFTSQVAYYLGE